MVKLDSYHPFSHFRPIGKLKLPECCLSFGMPSTPPRISLLGAFLKLSCQVAKGSWIIHKEMFWSTRSRGTWGKSTASGIGVLLLRRSTVVWCVSYMTDDRTVRVLNNWRAKRASRQVKLPLLSWEWKLAIYYIFIYTYVKIGQQDCTCAELLLGNLRM